MKSPEYIAHGTASADDAIKIESDGFLAEEGRATVSVDLIYAFGWASEQERRRGSKSESEIEDDETGRIIIMKTPADRSIDVATHTDISVDDEKKEITGYTLKYMGGRKQLGIYQEGDTVEQRGDIEATKREIAEVRQELQTYLESFGIDGEGLRSEEDLVAATHEFDVTEQMEIMSAVGGFREKLAKLRQGAESPIDIDKENILLSLVPSAALGAKLEEMKNDIYSLKKIDFDRYTEELMQTIESDEENTIESGVDIETVVREILKTTVEAEVMTMVRSLSMDAKRVQGYAVFNRGGDDLVEKDVDKDVLIEKLEAVREIIESEDFDIGSEKLNRYVKFNLHKIMEDLQ